MNKINTVIELLSKKNKIINYNLFNKISSKLINKKLFEIEISLEGVFNKHILNVDTLLESMNTEELEWRANQYMNYKFDILGSGWLSAKKIDENKIDWNIDFKTKKSIYKEFDAEVDIKNIWELSRLYHAPQLALYSTTQSESLKKKIELEIYTQITELFELPRDHPCWKSPMDVAIRSCNQLISIDIFKANKKSIFNELEIEKNLKKIFNSYLKYLVNNLELNFVTGKHGNHYLSNLVGILFICSYYGSAYNTNLFDFATKELLEQIDQQILEDGSIYECSTFYSRLSCELIFFSVAMIVRNREKTIEEFQQKKIFRLLEFLEQLTVSGDLIQIGDNDSGHLFKLNVDGNFTTVEEASVTNVNYQNFNCKERIIFDENCLSTKEVLGFYELFNVDTSKYSSLSKLYLELSERNFFGTTNKKENKKQVIDEERNLFEQLSYTKNLTFDSGIPDFSPNIKIFENFGLIKISSLDANFIVFLRNPFDVKDKLLAHVHDDLFSIQVITNGKYKYRDIGSYIYTPDKYTREYFRSFETHLKPVFLEPNIVFSDIFTVECKVNECKIEIQNKKIIVRASWDSTIFIRIIEIEDSIVKIKDSSNKEFYYNVPDEKLVSLGYGKINIEVESI